MTSSQRFGLFTLIISYPVLFHLWSTKDINTLPLLFGLLLMFGMLIFGTYKFLDNK